jgi:hypothetical protein
MKMNHILSAVAAVASFAGSAFAGTPVTISTPAPTPAPAPAAASSLSGSLRAGYATNYTCRGLVASHSLVEGDSVIPVGLDLEYTLNDHNAIVAGVSYTAITSGHHAWGFEEENFQNATSVNLGWENSALADGLTTTLGWNLNQGGLLGYLAKHENEKAHSVTNEFYLNINYDFDAHWFAGVTTSYSFQGVTGWWYQPYVGYKADLCPNTGIRITAGMSATSSYFKDSWGINNANGAQAWYLQLELPIKLGTDSLQLVPFVSANWAGCGALKAQKGFEEGDKPFKNFGVVAGANVVFSF